MTIELLPSAMMGHWTHCDPKVCEFQHGATMIYVDYSDDKPMGSRLSVAQTTIQLAFNEMDSVLEFAHLISEHQSPEFWQNASRINLRQHPLIVFAIRYPIDSDAPIYEISWNPLFKPESGIALSDEGVDEQVHIGKLPDDGGSIFVKRLGAHRYVQVA
ncbi:MAG: hypothetical protein QM766_07160 [Burkholderiaceae bacterium]